MVAVWFVNVAHPHNPCKSERVSPHRVELAQARKKKRQTGDAGQGGAKFDGPTPNGPGWCHEEAMLCSHLPADFFPHTTSDRPLPRAYLAQGIVQIAAFCPPSKRAPLVFPAHEDA